MKSPSQRYREHMRQAVTMFWEPKYNGLRSEPVSSMRIGDLESLYELIMDGHKPQWPRRYRPHPSRRLP